MCGAWSASKVGNKKQQERSAKKAEERSNKNLEQAAKAKAELEKKRAVEVSMLLKEGRIFKQNFGDLVCEMKTFDTDAAFTTAAPEESDSIPFRVKKSVGCFDSART